MNIQHEKALSLTNTKKYRQYKMAKLSYLITHVHISAARGQIELQESDLPRGSYALH